MRGTKERGPWTTTVCFGLASAVDLFGISLPPRVAQIAHSAHFEALDRSTVDLDHFSLSRNARLSLTSTSHCTLQYREGLS